MVANHSSLTLLRHHASITYAPIAANGSPHLYAPTSPRLLLHVAEDNPQCLLCAPRRLWPCLETLAMALYTVPARLLRR